jgi:hypothetical protein
VRDFLELPPQHPAQASDGREEGVDGEERKAADTEEAKAEHWRGGEWRRVRVG